MRGRRFAQHSKGTGGAIRSSGLIPAVMIVVKYGEAKARQSNIICYITLSAENDAQSELLSIVLID